LNYEVSEDRKSVSFQTLYLKAAHVLSCHKYPERGKAKRAEELERSFAGLICRKRVSRKSLLGKMKEFLSMDLRFRE